MSGRHLGGALDAGTRAWWRLVGRRVDLDDDHRWLDAPSCGPGPVGASWLAAEADRIGGTVHEDVVHGGLLSSMSVLDGARFRAADLDPAVRHFYERTSCWRMEVWAQWSAPFQPAGELVSRVFGRRVQQLALPTRLLDGFGDAQARRYGACMFGARFQLSPEVRLGDVVDTLHDTADLVMKMSEATPPPLPND